MAKTSSKAIKAPTKHKSSHSKSKRSRSIIFDAITLEGGLVSSVMLARVAAREAPAQSDADYGVPKGLTLRDEIARYFRIGAALFKDFAASPTPSTAAAISFMEGLLGQVLGFTDVELRKDNLSGVSLEAKKGRVPVIVVPPFDDLDRASTHLTGEGRRRSAASALQDWLNHTDHALWGFCTNGDRLRLMRDNASLTRPAFVEVNLREIFESENFADFAAVWQLFHATRFGAAGTPRTDSTLERWREAGASEGLVARERLRDGVETALLALGNGFLGHPENSRLRTRVTSGELLLPEFFGQLLRLVYRLIFLLVAEDRGLLHPPDSATSASKLYDEGYSLSALRDRAIRRTAWDQHFDRWEGLLIAFAGLAQGQVKLALPALGGLFEDVIPDLERARLSNRALMEAVYRLAWLKEDASLVPVNWRDMETEELGSVYESLLELTPVLVDHGRGFTFAEGDETKGNQRKTSGSYYTPDSLVQTLLDSALDPILDRVESESNDKVQGLLGVTLIDPACGSGHFLLAAARRIAARVARARTGGVASADDYRHALRDVVRSCIHGVDRNPLAVELTKVALWIETVEPGKPLGFLDASILCGDALLGVFDLEVLRQGIPDAAYKPLSGDDKDAAKYFDRRNKLERDAGQGTFDFAGGKNSLPAAPPLAASLRAVRALPEDSTSEIAEKKRRLAAARSERQLWNWRIAADLYIAAFLLPKKDVPSEPGAALVPTTDHVWRTISGGQVYGPLVGAAREVADKARVFHWPLEFPDIMAQSGFSLALGNPPWERIKLQEREFFAAREPDIAQASTGDARGKLISKLESAAVGSREHGLYQEFIAARRLSESSSIFARGGERFPLSARGDVNTYALFVELVATVIKTGGRAGIIVPTGLATEGTTAPLFAHLVTSNRLLKLLDFENKEAIFQTVHRSFRFSLLTIGHNSGDAEFAFFLTRSTQANDEDRRFALSPSAIADINPNTLTAPVFRSKADAALTRRIYAKTPVLMLDSNAATGNPWSFDYMTKMFDMTDNSFEFKEAAQLSNAGLVFIGNEWRAETRQRFVPVYEAKAIHLYDHRWATFDGEDARDSGFTEKMDPNFESRPRYWLPTQRVAERLATKSWTQKWLMGWRDITNATNERTIIAAVYPAVAVGNTIHNMFVGEPPIRAAAFIACLSALVVDYVARQKLGGTHLTLEILKQLPILPPSYYGNADLALISKRVLELCYTSYSIASFAEDLGYSGPPFPWNEDRRAILRAELDAWYAHAYGLTRAELRYILDPADVMGEDYPSETFRVLKNNEMKRFGEYRTRRLVLEAWDRMEAGDLK